MVDTGNWHDLLGGSAKENFFGEQHFRSIDFALLDAYSESLPGQL
jgi:hypothetical protein